MHRAWIPVLLFSATARADVPIGPEPPVLIDGNTLQTCACPPAPVVRHPTVSGYVHRSNQPLAGATIIIMQAGGTAPAFTAISDENGDYSIAVPPGIYDIDLYYLETTIRLATDRMIVTDVTLPMVTVPVDDGRWSCAYPFPLHAPSADSTSLPRQGLTATHPMRPISRDRTHRSWIAPVAMADSQRTVTSVDRGARFTGSPGIPIAFIDEVETHTVRVPGHLAAGSGGGSLVTLRFGTNETKSEARLVLGLDRNDRELGASGDAEMIATGPLVTDRLWAASGLAARRNADGSLGADGMVQLAAKPRAEHDLAVAGLVHGGDDQRAGWANARWSGHFLDFKLELGTVATTEAIGPNSPAVASKALPSETLDPIELVTRTGAYAYLKWRGKAAGHHQIYASAGGGAGTRDGDRHADATYAIHDDWNVTSNTTVTAGVRSEFRRHDTERITVVAPRAGITWTPDSGRGEGFVAYQRVPHVDDGMPGDWKSLTTPFHDELLAGVAYRRLMGRVMVGIAARVRQDDAGGELWLRHEGAKTVVHAQATSLDRVATLLAQRKLIDKAHTMLALGVTARIGEERSEGGAAMSWRRTPAPDSSSSRRELSTELAVEGYAGTTGPGGRLLLGILW